eukprot:TRINITY_DN4606_c0_g1_i2.p1 TRINITY_DN4606_c0_g1~~TRINITY_DN4606_c0_g1_i2.p1  ORF type:complete len:151 (-),score=4.68 TRINITY_DN4606_c0_g1_i2:30-482(-)
MLVYLSYNMYNTFYTDVWWPYNITHFVLGVAAFFLCIIYVDAYVINNKANVSNFVFAMIAISAFCLFSHFFIPSSEVPVNIDQNETLSDVQPVVTQPEVVKEPFVWPDPFYYIREPWCLELYFVYYTVLVMATLSMWISVSGSVSLSNLY